MVILYVQIKAKVTPAENVQVNLKYSDLLKWDDISFREGDRAAAWGITELPNPESFGSSV